MWGWFRSILFACLFGKCMLDKNVSHNYFNGCAMLFICELKLWCNVYNIFVNLWAVASIWSWIVAPTKFIVIIEDFEIYLSITNMDKENPYAILLGVHSFILLKIFTTLSLSIFLIQRSHLDVFDCLTPLKRMEYCINCWSRGHSPHTFLMPLTCARSL